MSVIKLSAIDSTNDYLKELSRNQIVENFTTVVANKQTKGRGQMGAAWVSEEGKNLITSILIKDVLQDVDEIFHLNVAVALSIFEVLKANDLPNLAIKWPNDIMSEQKKIAGILIENSIKSDGKIESVVGIGLNVNQKSFENLPKASSMAVVTNSEFDLDEILNQLIFQIKKNCSYILTRQTDRLWQDYHCNLYKINVPLAFEDANQHKFMGIIQGVSTNGLLEIKLEDDSIKSFGIKEVQILL
ncbi:biotin--[acetyl-CoA-carboxylase] ligase [Flavobacterium sp.]|uniref:biotin--[acetyl-CoA-carboxylase] ligase n=1 Tax=Flavobacterium sp. TaxID=239 RepID=UPI0038D20CAE